MTPQELMDVRDLLLLLRDKSLSSEYKRIVESIRVVQRDIDLQTTDYVRNKRNPIFTEECKKCNGLGGFESQSDNMIMIKCLDCDGTGINNETKTRR